mgnify:CR=1 FL=1
MSTTRTLLLTDVVDSTALVERLGDGEAARVWRAHDRVARDLLPEHNGLEIDKTDGFLLLFERVRDAVAYAVAYHNALAELSTSLGISLSARAGLHVGEVELHENTPEDVARGAKPLEVEGIAKPTAARVMSLARGHQTLLTEAARADLPDDLGTHQTVSHGHWRLKGVARPVELFEVGDEDGLFKPPPDAAKAYRVVQREGAWVPARELPGNLGPQPDRYVGRDEELAELARLLEAGMPVVTITGTKGMGKTRLALHHGRSWAGNYPGGTWFLDARDLRDSRSLDAAAEQLLGPLNRVGVDGLDRLLIVDAPGAPELLQPLLAIPHLRLLVTHRSPLGLPAERTVHLAGLPTDSAAELFRGRAGPAAARLADAHIDRLVGILDGIPRDIEQAAVRARGGTEARPFKGLHSFSADDADLFFGRDAESQELAQQLRTRALVTVTGVSGAGKTSLIQAGVLRHMPDQAVVVIRPGTAPDRALEVALEAHAPERLEVVRRTMDPGDGPPLPAVTVDRTLLLIVDQAEELLTVTRDAATRERFAQALWALTALPRTHVAFSVREDFFARLADVSALRGHYNRSVAVVTRPERPQLLETLVKPAALFGHLFEEGLAEEMVDTVAEEPAALAMLQFCADQLWSRRDPGGFRLTRSDYDAVGGVAGAMATHADKVVDALSKAQQAEARRLLQRLVTQQVTKEPRLRDDLLASAPDPERARLVLDRLVEARLLRVYQADDGSPMVEVAHEALLRNWDRLLDWLGEDQEGQRLQRNLGRAAAEWEQRGRSADLLWRRQLLADLERWRARAHPRLTPIEAAFADASVRAERRVVWQRRALVTAAFTVVSSGALGATLLWQQAEHSALLAEEAAEAAARSEEEARIAQQVAVAEREIGLGNDLIALRLARDVLERDPTRAGARAVVLDTAIRASDTTRIHSRTSDRWDLWNPQFSRFLVHEEEGSVLRDRDGVLVGRVDADANIWRIAHWSPDGQHLATWHDDQIKLWTADGAFVAATAGKHGPIEWAHDSESVMVRSPEPEGADSEAGRTTLHLDGSVETDTLPWHRRIHRAGTTLVREMKGSMWLEDDHGTRIATAPTTAECANWEGILSPDGRRVASFGWSGCDGATLRLWDRDGQLAAIPLPGEMTLQDLAWNEAGDRLAVVTSGMHLRLFTNEGVELPLPEDPCVATHSVVWRGNQLVVGCYLPAKALFLDGTDGTITRSWPLQGVDDSGEPIGQGVGKLAFSADDTTLAVEDYGGVIHLWPADGPDERFVLDGPLVGCGWSPTGGHIAGGVKDRMTLWTRDGQPVGTIAHPVGLPLKDEHWRSDGSALAFAGEDTLFVWRPHEPEPSPLAVPVGKPGMLAWHPTQPLLAVVGSRGGGITNVETGAWTDLADLGDGFASRNPLSGGWSPDGTRLLVARDEGDARLWDVLGEHIGKTEQARVVHAAWMGDSSGFHLSASPWERKHHLYDRDGNRTETRPGVVLGGWDPTGERHVSSVDKQGVLVDTQTGAPLRELRSSAWLWSSTWSRSGRFLFTSSIADELVVRDRDGTARAAIPGGATRMAFCLDPREEYVTTEHSGQLRMWPLDDTQLLSRANELGPQPLQPSDLVLLR